MSVRAEKLTAEALMTAYAAAPESLGGRAAFERLIGQMAASSPEAQSKIADRIYEITASHVSKAKATLATLPPECRSGIEATLDGVLKQLGEVFRPLGIQGGKN